MNIDVSWRSESSTKSSVRSVSFRVVRSADKKPFIDADEWLLEHVAKSCRELLELWADASQDTAHASDIVPVLCSKYQGDWPRRTEVLNSTVEKICRSPQLNDGWTRPRVTAILRDLLFALRPVNAFGINFSIVADELLGGRELSVYAYEAVAEDDTSLPPQAEPVPEREQSNRWHAINTQKIQKMIDQFENQFLFR